MVKSPKQYLASCYEEGENTYLNFLMYFLLFFVAALLVFVMLVALVTVDGSSMNNSYSHNDNVLLLKNASARRGDVIVVNVVDGTEEKKLIKRTVAVAGDTLLFRESKASSSVIELYLKKAGEQEFILLNEGDYIKEPMDYTGNYGSNKVVRANATETEIAAAAITIKDGHFFALGDNRNHSLDSRCYGQFPVADLDGRVFYRLTQGSLLEKLLLILY